MNVTVMLPLEHPFRRFRKKISLALLILSAFCIGIAPLIMPEGYSWLALSISESAAQGSKGAWLARLGFILYGLAVIRISSSLRTVWPRGSYWAHLLFGLCMLGTAAFSHKPWLPNMPSDAMEDFLHSVTATGMGLAFTVGVAIRLLQRRQYHIPGIAIDTLALIAAIVVPMAMPNVESLTGILQRSMFAVGYIWYGRECTVGATSDREVKPHASADDQERQAGT